MIGCGFGLAPPKPNPVMVRLRNAWEIAKILVQPRRAKLILEKEKMNSSIELGIAEKNGEQYIVMSGKYFGDLKVNGNLTNGEKYLQLGGQGTSAFIDGTFDADWNDEQNWDLNAFSTMVISKTPAYTVARTSKWDDEDAAENGIPPYEERVKILMGLMKGEEE